MSAIGGIVSFNDCPVDTQSLAQLGHDLEVYGPDGGNNVINDAAGMVYRAFHTNHESRAEKQPLVHPGGLILTWDGRLDNREELINLLRDELQDDRTDVAVVMAAYRTWGITFLSRIIGDFALSLWDPSIRTLFLARDLVGSRLLFYHTNENRIVWSSRIEALLNAREIGLEVNDEYVAGYLTSRPTQGLTPYRNINAAPPGNVAIVKNGRVSLQRYWDLNPSKTISYRTDGEYEEHFIHLFSEAVRVRLRVDGPVCSDLSGGLDSSSIVCMADAVIRNEADHPCSLETISAVFDDSPSSDERRFIRLVEEKRGRAGHHFLESNYPLLAESVSDGSRAIPNPIELWAEYHKAVRKTMRARRARVLLCGIGGDELLTSSPDPSPELSDLLVQFKLGELHRRLQVWSLALKKPYLEVLLSHTVIPALPRRLRSYYKRSQRAKPLALLQPGFIKRFDLHAKLLGPADASGFRLPSARGQAIALQSVVDVISSGYLLAWDPIELSYPFTHRPLVEFLQAIPPTQWIRPGETRSLLRRAMRDYLPPEIAKRRGKGSPAEATLRAVAREWPRLQNLMRNALVCDAGYVNPQALKTLIDQPSPGCTPAGVALIRLSFLELWLRDLERRTHSVKRTSPAEFSTSGVAPALSLEMSK